MRERWKRAPDGIDVAEIASKMLQEMKQSSYKKDGLLRATVKRSIVPNGRRTSVSLENEFWNLIGHIASVHGISRSALIAKIDEDRGERTNLSSAIRLFVLEHFQAQAHSKSQ